MSADVVPADAAGFSLRVDLLDAPCLRADGGAPLMLERKDAALLALLALDGARSRAEVAALLWPDAGPARSRNSLRQRRFRLNRCAGIELIEGTGHLRLNAGATLDFDAAGERLARDPEAPLGELLGRHDYADCIALAEWVDAARQRWHARRADLLAQLASSHEAAGRIALALRYAQRLVDDAPLLEHAHRRLIRLHYLRGDRAAGLAAYARCRALLAEQLGTVPDRETMALARLVEGGVHERAGTRPTPVTVLRPPRLVGRDAERARLAHAIAGHEPLVVHGEPGIGKSHLLDDAVASRSELLAAAALAGETAVPYALLARVARTARQRFAAAFPGWVTHELARLVPEFGAAPASRLDPLRLQQALAAALDAWTAAGLGGLVIDDLHHADDASLEALLALAQAPRPLARVFGVRSHEMPAPLAAWIADDDARVATLHLTALDDAGVRELVDSLDLPGVEGARWSPALARHTGGNPLFVLETLRALLAAGGAPTPDDRLPVPGGVHALIERRLSRLSDAALRLARVAALAGTEFDADVAARVLDVHPLDIVEPWRELDDAQMFRHGRFAHDLIAETVARDLPEAIAQALHARLAAALDALGRAPARVAPHWARAAAWPRAGETYAAAASAAQRASRRADETALWEQAAQCFDRAGDAARAFDARIDSVESLLLVRGAQAAQALVERLAQDEQTEPQRLRRLTAAAKVSLMSGDAIGGEASARAALGTAARLGALWPRVAAARLLGVALAQTGRAADAREVIEPLREPVMAEGSDEQRGGFWADYAYVLRAGLHMRETADALREAIRFAQACDDHAELATLTSNLATIEGNFGHVEIALDLARRSRALRDPMGGVGGPSSGAIDMYVGVYSAGLGRYDDALADLERALECFERDGQPLWRAVVGNHQAAVLLDLGQLARARQALRAPPPMAGVRLRVAMLTARLARALGHADDGTLARTLDELGAESDPYVRLLAQLDVTLTLAPVEAVAACARVQAEAQALQAQAVALRAAVFRLDHLLRDGAAFDRSLPDALAQALLEAQTADLYPPHPWWTLHRAYAALDDTASAGAMLQRSFDWVTARALPHVPPPFVASFLERNPVNRAVVAAAGRLLGLHVPPQIAAPR